MARNVLLICQLFYPANVPGSQRAGKLAKYLPKYGWTPCVLAGRISGSPEGLQDESLVEQVNCQVCEVPFREPPAGSFRRMLRLQVIPRVLPAWEPPSLYRGLLKRGRELLRQQRFDAIWATSPFLTALSVASKLSREFSIPWVADIRDTMHDMTEKMNALYRWHVRVETKLCNRAATVIAVTQSFVDELKQRVEKPVHLVHNGFDPDDFPKPGEKGENSGFFDIVYSGTLYADRNPTPLFDALDILLDRHDAEELAGIRVLFYSVREETMEPFLRNHKCAHLIHLKPRVPLREMSRIESNAAVLLLLAHHKVQGIIPLKTYGYLGAQRPILSIPGDHSVTDALLARTQAGVAIKEPERIADTLWRWYQEWKQTGTVSYNGIEEEINFYTRENQAKKTAEILDAVLRQTPR